MLDTHLVLWWEDNHPKLPPSVRNLVLEQSEAVFVSRASLWEMAIKISLKRLRVGLPKFIQNVEMQGFEWLDIRNEHLLAVSTLPIFDDHKDPFDRLLVAQSLTEPLILLSCDDKLARYGATVRIV
ncbi:MAG: type II toxin-antitoxin system VapC family toxin [Methylococcaceae bacterium]|nr:type II toxin-antitoxin system VapC family toxin [Methylococcaceae bacterium]